MSDTPDIHHVGFSIHELCRDMWVFGKHYIRPSDDVKFEECFDCQGWGCFSGDKYGDRYKHCTEDQCFCSRIDPDLRKSRV
jgi:hypothetical protein